MKEDLIAAFKKLVESATSYTQFKTIGYKLTIRDVLDVSISTNNDGNHTIQYKNMKCDISFDEKSELEKLFINKEKRLFDIAIEDEYNELRKYIFETK